MKAPARASRDEAELLAVQALAFIAGEPERLARFLGVTGITVESLRASAGQPGFLAGVLEHMLGDERLLVAFADHAGIDPGDVARAHGAIGSPWERDLP